MPIRPPNGFRRKAFDLLLEPNSGVTGRQIDGVVELRYHDPFRVDALGLQTVSHGRKSFFLTMCKEDCRFHRQSIRQPVDQFVSVRMSGIHIDLPDRRLHAVLFAKNRNRFDTSRKQGPK